MVIEITETKLSEVVAYAKEFPDAKIAISSDGNRVLLEMV